MKQCDRCYVCVKKKIYIYEPKGRILQYALLLLTAETVEIIEEMKKDSATPFRPPLEVLDVQDYILRCIRSCWHEEPDQRPDIRFVRIMLKEMQVNRKVLDRDFPIRIEIFQAGLKPNIFDNMLAIMEKYAYNLEGLVQERTNQLTEEKKKTDALLHRMLPK